MNVNTAKRIGVLILAGLAWEAVVRLGFISRIVLPPPSEVVLTLATLLVTPAFLLDIAASVARVSIALSVSVILGTLVGLSTGYFRPVHTALYPLIAVTQPIPKIMLLPVIIILLGFGDLSRVVLIFLGCVYVIVYAAYQGARNVDPILIEAARSLGACETSLFTKVVFPYALPHIVGGTKAAVGLALILMFFSETLATEYGLGYFVMTSWNFFDMPRVFAGIIVTSLIGVFLVSSIEILESRLMPWRTRDTH